MPNDRLSKLPGVVRADGFTLPEMMIALAIGAFVLGAVFTAYNTQQKSYINQERVADMQQNLRSTINTLVSDIRMAGYNPSGNANSAGITLAEPGRLSMEIDWDGDGDTNDGQERLDFGFAEATDDDDDGIPDNGEPASIGRRFGGAGGYQPIGDNFESIEFRYLDKEGNETAVLSKIRSVQISLLAIADGPDRQYFNRTTYQPASGPKANWKQAANVDNFRRRLLITTVACRNMGL